MRLSVYNPPQGDLPLFVVVVVVAVVLVDPLKTNQIVDISIYDDDHH